MSALLLTGNSLNRGEMEYHGNFGHTLWWIQHIVLMSIILICYTSCCLATQNVAPTLPGFQGIELCIQYMASHPQKPIFYPSNSYDGSNFIRLTWSGNQVEDYTTQNCLVFHQDADHARIISIRRSVSGIICTLLIVAVCCKLQIQQAVYSEPTGG